MSRPVARLGDRTDGVCFGHPVPLPIGGEIITASTDTLTNTPRGTARIGDTVRADCGHTGQIVSGSPNVYANNRNVARLNDNVKGTYVAKIVTASGNVNAEP